VAAEAGAAAGGALGGAGSFLAQAAAIETAQAMTIVRFIGRSIRLGDKACSSSSRACPRRTAVERHQSDVGGGDGDLRVRRAEELGPHLQRLLQQRFRAVKIALLVPETSEVVQVGGDQRMLLAEELAVDA